MTMLMPSEHYARADELLRMAEELRRDTIGDTTFSREINETIHQMLALVKAHAMLAQVDPNVAHAAHWRRRAEPVSVPS